MNLKREFPSQVKGGGRGLLWLRPKLKILWRRPSWVQKRGNALKFPPPALNRLLGRESKLQSSNEDTNLLRFYDHGRACG